MRPDQISEMIERQRRREIRDGIIITIVVMLLALLMITGLVVFIKG